VSAFVLGQVWKEIGGKGMEYVRQEGLVDILAYFAYHMLESAWEDYVVIREKWRKKWTRVQVRPLFC
jgi:predicted GIY-YIG superfamily endonuclease